MISALQLLLIKQCATDMHSTRCYCLTFRLGVVKPYAHACQPILHFLIFLNQTQFALRSDVRLRLHSLVHIWKGKLRGKGGWNQLLGHFKSMQSEAAAVGRLGLDA